MLAGFLGAASSALFVRERAESQEGEVGSDDVRWDKGGGGVHE